jgi:NSS family neurotransmitter:Na+ symporter
MGQVVAYASRKRDDSRIVKSGILICLFDFLFSFLAGLTVFATMGFLASAQGVGLNELKLDGLFLAFVSYPMAISLLPLAPLWGVLFFLLLVSLGIDSAFAAIEATLTGCEDLAPKRTRKVMALMLCGIGFLGGIVFLTGSGLIWLDIVDHWVAYYSMGAIIVLQCIVFGKSRTISQIALHIKTSWSKFALLSWRTLVFCVIPLALLVIFGGHAISELSARYGGYPSSALAIGGWGVTVLTIACGVLLGLRHNRR